MRKVNAQANAQGKTEANTRATPGVAPKSKLRATPGVMEDHAWIAVARMIKEKKKENNEADLKEPKMMKLEDRLTFMTAKKAELLHL